MNYKCIGIAGGSGSGKSSLAISLCQKFPEQFALLHIDDYFKPTADVPKFGEFSNWDDPDAIRFDDLRNDIKALLLGESVKVLTKGELYNPEFTIELKNKKEVIIEPKPTVILEGYLALHDTEIRELMDLKMYLDISITESIRRRSTNKFAINDDYLHNVLIPMHWEFVEPTKQYADLIIDVSDKTQEEVFEIVVKSL